MSRFSKPVRFSSTAAYWPVRPIRSRSRSGSRRTSTPATRARALVGLEERRQDPDGGRLAGAVRAEEPEDGPGRDVQVDAAERLDVPVALAEPPCLDGGLGRHARDASEGARAGVVLIDRAV